MFYSLLFNLYQFSASCQAGCPKLSRATKKLQFEIRNAIGDKKKLGNPSLPPYAMAMVLPPFNPSAAVPLCLDFKIMRRCCPRLLSDTLPVCPILNVSAFKLGIYIMESVHNSLKCNMLKT